VHVGAVLLKSPLNQTDTGLQDYLERFLQEINKQMVKHSVYISDASILAEQGISLVFVGSGGSAHAFKELSEHLAGPFYFLTTPRNNSLAASMEMLSYLQLQGLKGKILYGSAEMIASALDALFTAHEVRESLRQTHLGVLGKANMLIASDADPSVLKANCGATLEEIQMEEVLEEIGKNAYEPTVLTEHLKVLYNPLEVEKALYVYGGVRRIVDRYHFDGIALRCFDLLEPRKISGCLALAILNAEGVYAACEGDTRSLVSMVVLGKLSGKPVFMANPSSIDTKRKIMVFAHCVLPLNMPKSYSLTTHFESGLGVAVKGELRDGLYTMFKCREDLKQYHAQVCKSLGNGNNPDSCRTQLLLEVKDYASLLENPLSNHQMLCEGDHMAAIQAFFHDMEGRP